MQGKTLLRVLRRRQGFSASGRRVLLLSMAAVLSVLQPETGARGHVTSRRVKPVRMPPGAYLSRPASSGHDLQRQLDEDKRVLHRYVRLFRLSPVTVHAAFGQMRTRRLLEDHLARIYYVHAGEMLGYKLRRIRKGTVVFAIDGIPILVKVCGNPLRLGRRDFAKTIPPNKKIPDFTPDEAVVPLGNNRVPRPSDFIPDYMALPPNTPSFTLYTQPYDVPGPGLIDWTGIPPAGGTSFIPPPTGTGSFTPPPFVPFPPLFGGTGDNPGGGNPGGGGPGGGPGGDNPGGGGGDNNPPSPTPVPEGNSLLLFLGAAGGFLLWRMRYRLRRT